MRDSTIPPREEIAPQQDPLPCPRCQTLAPLVEGPGTALHYARLSCAHCGAFLRWRKWPRDQDGNRLPRPSSLEPHNQISEALP